MLQNQLPEELQRALDGEEKEFVVYSKRSQPPRNGCSMLGFSLFWLGFTSFFVYGFFGGLVTDGEVHFTSNGRPVTATLENLAPLIMPGLFIGIFVLVGLFLLFLALKMILPNEVWYVGTPSRFIVYNSKKITSYDWEKFSGDLEIRNRGDKKDLALGLRHTASFSANNSGAGNVIYMFDVEDVDKVERICRKRIKENDPTPVNK